MELAHIKQVRRTTGMTQQELAQKAGVSQSLIAKIESNLINPSYEYANKIIQALEQEHTENEPVVKEFMTARVRTCNPTDSVQHVIKRMQNQAISQLPVLQEKTVVGLITETSLLQHILDKNPKTLIVKDIMQPPPPLFDENTPKTTIVDVLKRVQLVGVTQNGVLKGVVTRSDIIKNTYG